MSKEDYCTRSVEAEEGPRPSPTLRNFNPSENLVVDSIKKIADELINYINENVPAGRERSIAVTNIEQGAMWAVKANFVDNSVPMPPETADHWETRDARVQSMQWAIARSGGNSDPDKVLEEAKKYAEYVNGVAA